MIKSRIVCREKELSEIGKRMDEKEMDAKMDVEANVEVKGMKA